MDVLLTGPYGLVGTAILDHLYEEPNYDWTLFNRSDRPDDHTYGSFDTIVADINDAEQLRDAVRGHDAIVHMAGASRSTDPWSEVHEGNIVGTYNVLEAAREAGVESVIYGSSHHAMGGYEDEYAPEIYEEDFPLVLHHDDPPRPDSYYGVSKLFSEDLGRYYVEYHGAPKRFYSLRICNVSAPEYDDPYGRAEEAVQRGDYERGSKEYRARVARRRAHWCSRRDMAQLVDRCLRDQSVTFDIFHGVSDNRARWFDLEHARAILGYHPQDDAGDPRWDELPDRYGEP